MLHTSLTKEDLNKQIVLLRTSIKNARSLEVNRMLRKMKKLQKSTNNNNGGDKNGRKIARLLLEIGEMKKLNFNEVAKFGLLNEAPFSEVMRKGSVNQRATIRLCETDLVKKQVSAFREKYPKWKVEVASIFHIWSFNKKMFGSKRKKNTIDSANGDILGSTKASLLKDVPSSPSVTNNKNPKPNLTKRVTKNEKPAVIVLNQQKGTELDPNCHLTMLENVDSQDKVEKMNKGVQPTLKQLNQIMMAQLSEDLGKTEGEIEVKRIKLADLEDEILVGTATKIKGHSNDVIETSVHKVTSSFFIDPDESVADDLHQTFTPFSDDRQKEHPLNHQSLKRFESCSNAKKRFQHGNAYGGIKHSAQNMRIRPSLDSKRNVCQRTKDNLIHRNQPTKVQCSKSVISEPLHPSWEAKRKQCVSISTFKGVKIKFDDGD